MTPEVVQLVAALDAQRSGVLTKMAGLSEADGRRSTVDSGTNLAGLLQHLTFVESKWFDTRVMLTSSANRSTEVAAGSAELMRSALASG